MRVNRFFIFFQRIEFSKKVATRRPVEVGVQRLSSPGIQSSDSRNCIIAIWVVQLNPLIGGTMQSFIDFVKNYDKITPYHFSINNLENGITFLCISADLFMMNGKA